MTVDGKEAVGQQSAEGRDPETVTSQSEKSARTACGKISLSQEIAAECFGAIASRFYDRNFGTLTKGELDLLMFEFFNTHALNDKGTPFTDYEVARLLALTPQRVQNLRSKIALKSEDEPDWRESFRQLVNAQRYTLMNSREQTGCEVRLNFKSMIDVYAFRDALAKRDIYQDGSFSGLIVTTTLAGVLEILFEELAGVEYPSNVAEDGALNYLLRNIKLKELPEDVRESVSNILKDNALLTSTSASRILVKGVDRSTAPQLFKGLLTGVGKLAECPAAISSETLGFLQSVFEGFSNFGIS